ncbi:hypothetical protein BKA70DRAFT_1341832 [Coprinopsis sp. MPI-PUGE-AT-0042]|nr:hypothetical protein BKA70DRAFT_1341832 [Coprinopsis sp. MPI-PUGE-AT-0042]
MDKLDRIAASPPPELALYVTSNDVLPSILLPCLDTFLHMISRPIERLEDEIAALEKILRGKKEMFERAKRVEDAHRRIKAPVRKVPTEVLGLIFCFALDEPIFNKYREVSSVRRVCSSWRHVAMTTPSILTTLHINLSKWCRPELDIADRGALSLQFSQALAPWTSVLSHSYHLNVASSFYERRDTQKLLVHHLLSSTPLPNTTTFDSQLALDAALASPFAYPHIEKVHMTRPTLCTSDSDKLGHIFPNLGTLILDSIFDCGSDSLDHTSLQMLDLSDVRGAPESFAQVMTGLPALRELRLDSSEPCILGAPPPNSHPVYDHPSIEVLMIRGEDIVSLFRYLALPSLRFLVIWGLTFHTDPTLYDEILPRILARSPPEGLLISLRGEFHQAFLAQIVQYLPPHSHLHFAASIAENEDGSTPQLSIESDNLEEIFCDNKTGDLSWLGGAPGKRTSSRLLTIHTATPVAVPAQTGQEGLEGAGYNLKMQTPEEIKNMLCSLAPEFSAASEWIS